MRNYIELNRIKVSRAQLDLLVPAFDSVWAELQRRGGFLHDPSAAQRMRDRAANTVVELVLVERMNDPPLIAAVAIGQLLPDAQREE